MEFDPARLRRRAKTARDKRLINQMSRIVDWACKKGLNVMVSDEQSYSWGRDINLKNGRSFQTMLFELLHECGHYLISRDTTDRFDMGYPVVGTRKIRKQARHRVAVLDEELEAWARGGKLAHRLGIKLDKKRYDLMKASHITTYCKFVLDRDVSIAAYAVT